MHLVQDAVAVVHATSNNSVENYPGTTVSRERSLTIQTKAGRVKQSIKTLKRASRESRSTPRHVTQCDVLML